MKISIRKTVLLLAVVTCTNITSAQKIAHLSFDSLISLMPETKTATDAAQLYFKGLEQASIEMQNELETKYRDYMEKQAGMNDLLKKTREEELQQLQTRIQDFQRQAEMDFKRKQAELTAPIYQKAKKGIETVAKEGGYKYILDTSLQNSSVLYSEPTDDVLMLVKKKLDGMPLAAIPGASTTSPAPPVKQAPGSGGAGTVKGSK